MEDDVYIPKTAWDGLSVYEWMRNAMLRGEEEDIIKLMKTFSLDKKEKYRVVYKMIKNEIKDRERVQASDILEQRFGRPPIDDEIAAELGSLALQDSSATVDGECYIINHESLF